MKLSAAAAVLSTAIASPVLAQDSMYRRGPVTQEYNYSNRDDGYRDRGFWPGGVAAGIVGGAVGTADAMARAPFRNSYDARFLRPGQWLRVPARYLVPR
ncbi:hypothetical protein V1281_004882 [Nitrobacteraceae bacterium AZCC 2161]|jgi:hypothetical protein